jgi:ATP-dependent Clp protease ATP-binding subunit ClpC
MVMALARKEAQRLESEYIDTEHILVAMIEETRGVAAKVLINLNVDKDTVFSEIEKFGMPAKSSAPNRTLIHFSPRAKKSIEQAQRVAEEYGLNVIGTVHLLLGLMEEKEGTAAKVLFNLGLKLDQVRKTAEKLSSDYSEDE